MADNYFSRIARMTRSALRRAKYQNITGLEQHSRTGGLTTQNVGQNAIMLVSSMLSNYILPYAPKLSYSGLRNARVADSTSKIEDGVVTVFAEMQTPGGVRVAFDVPVEIRSGEFIDPSLIVVGGIPRVMAQSTFRDLVARVTSVEPVPVRDMYSSPLPGHLANNAYQNRQYRTRYNPGIYSIAANKRQLQAAVSGTAIEQILSDDARCAAAPGVPHLPTLPKTPGISKPPKSLNPPKPPKSPKPPKPPKSPKPPKLPKLCPKCNHAPCICHKKKQSQLDVPPQFPKKCNVCGTVYASMSDWQKLPPPGSGKSRWETDFAIFDMRNCSCGSTLAVEIQRLKSDDEIGADDDDVLAGLDDVVIEVIDAPDPNDKDFIEKVLSEVEQMHDAGISEIDAILSVESKYGREICDMIFADDDAADDAADDA